MIVRDRECLECGHAWTAPVQMGSPVTLSGEMKVRCPECNSGSIVSLPQYSSDKKLFEVALVVENVRYVLVEASDTYEACDKARSLCWSVEKVSHANEVKKENV
jgi:DNA-directed RNA polymerase subunit RPC12/RpoP